MAPVALWGQRLNRRAPHEPLQRLGRGRRMFLARMDDGEDLYWKTEAVYTLVVLRLLRECGLQEAALPNRDNSEPMRRLAGRLADQADRSGGG